MIPIGTALYYIWLLADTYMHRDTAVFFKTFFIPLAAFIIVTVFRKIVNAHRPYEADKTVPLIRRTKSGQSFPSRHTASLGIIAMAGLYSSVSAGMILWVMTVIQGVIRVICGAHYPKDVFAGMIFSAVFGILFFL